MSGIQPRNTEVTRNRRGEEFITFEPFAGRVRGLVDGKVVVDSERVMLLKEGRLDPVLYFPRDDVRMDLLERNERSSYCPYRGAPAYFDLVLPGRRVESIAWSYEEPYEDAAYVREYVAFYRDLVDDWQFPERTQSEVEPLPMSPNPLADWMVREAWQATSLPDLVMRWVEALSTAGIELVRFALVTRTLHPQLSGATYRWQRATGDVTTTTVEHEVLTTSQYLDSPLVPIFEGAGGVRRRLDGSSERDDFPILAEIRAEGGTDYVAMPLVFSDGQINAVTIASDRPRGFETGDLGLINEVLPLFSRLVEVFMQREKAQTLLNTYLGAQTGRRVLDGKVRRGDGENIHAVIWFCDLRDSSALAAEMSREDFLNHLNCYFDCMAGAVIEHGGEVLRFIGDAALAIFPFEPGEKGEAPACRRALDAARDACERVRKGNEAARAAARPEIGFGIGLHVGDVTYGNIGTAARLEFTVIGAAANEAARIESLSKTLAHPVLLSGDFAATCPGDYESLGRHDLRGTGRSQEIFAPRW